MLSSSTRVQLCSSGNHGAALAHAARTADTSATIIMPSTAPECKVSAARGSGATVVMCEPTMQARQDAATAHSNENPNDTFIPPYNHPHTIAGQGTVGLELLEQVYTGEIMCIGTAAGRLPQQLPHCVDSAQGLTSDHKSFFYHFSIYPPTNRPNNSKFLYL